MLLEQKFGGGGSNLIILSRMAGYEQINRNLDRLTLDGTLLPLAKARFRVL